jgi:uncharacterized protein
MKGPFHLAFPVTDLSDARRFYGELLECPEGRSSDTWIDFDLFGHQIVTHLAPGREGSSIANRVDSDDVPVPHFGVILPMDEWRRLADKLTDKGMEFVIKPKIRFAGEIGEQATMFFLDPSGNALEFKGFKDLDSIFAK